MRSSFILLHGGLRQQGFDKLPNAWIAKGKGKEKGKIKIKGKEALTWAN